MCSSLSEKIDGPAEGLRVCNSEPGNVLTRSWFRIRLRYIPMDKVSTMRAGQKGFPTATQNNCETHPRREATLTRVDFQGVKTLLKDSHGDLIPRAVSATRNRGAWITSSALLRRKDDVPEAGHGLFEFERNHGALAGDLRVARDAAADPPAGVVVFENEGSARGQRLAKQNHGAVIVDGDGDARGGFAAGDVQGYRNADHDALAAALLLTGDGLGGGGRRNL